MNNFTDELITLDELCEILMIGKNQAYTLLNSENGIAAFRIGRIWKIPKSSVYNYISEQTKSKKEPGR